MTILTEALSYVVQWNLQIMDTFRDECFVHSARVHSLEVEMYGQYTGRGKTVCQL